MSRKRNHQLLELVFCVGLISVNGAPIFAQNTGPISEGATIQALLAEVRQLRMTLERSALVLPRFQIAFQKMQFQQGRVDRLTQQLEESRQRALNSVSEDAEFARNLKEAEARLSNEQDPLRRKELESMIKGAKTQLEQQAQLQQQRQVRESELQGQLQTEQRKLDELADQMSALEKSVEVLSPNK